VKIRQTHRLEDRRRDVGAALAVLADAGLDTRARQQHADLQRSALSTEDGGRGERRGSRGRACEDAAAVGQHANARHGDPP
jgi:hypothetical protein